jgi:hypothetical protein
MTTMYPRQSQPPQINYVDVAHAVLQQQQQQQPQQKRSYNMVTL